MPIAFDAVSIAGVGSDVTSLSLSHTAAGTDRIALVFVANYRTDGSAPSGPSGITYGGIPMKGAILNSLTGFSISGRAANASFFYLLNPPTGAQTVATTVTGIFLGGYRMVCATYTGVQGVGGGIKFASETGSPNWDAVESEVGSLVVACQARVGGSAVSSIGTGTARLNSSSSGAPGAIALFDVPGAQGTVTPTATSTGTDWTLLAINLVASDSGSVAVVSQNSGAGITGSSTTLSTSFYHLLDTSDATTFAVVRIGSLLTTAAGTFTCNVTYGGVAMTELKIDVSTTVLSTGEERALGLFYLPNPPTGTQNIVATTGGTKVKTALEVSLAIYNNVAKISSNSSSGTGNITTTIPAKEKERIVFTFLQPYVFSYGSGSNGTANIPSLRTFSLNGLLYDGQGKASATYSFTTGSAEPWMGISARLSPEPSSFFYMF